MQGKKLTIEYVREQFEKEDYKLLATRYINNTQKLGYICPERHRHFISWSGWQKGDRCPYCAGNARLAIEFVKAEFAREDYVLLATGYINNMQKLPYECPNGHRHNITWNNWIVGNRCPYCSGKDKKTIEFIRSEFEKENYKLLTTEYINAHTKLDYICPKGHKHQITWSKWNKKRRCPHCFNRRRGDCSRLGFNFIKSEFEKENHVLITTVYSNAKQKLHVVCPNEHDYYVTWDNWSQGKRCPKCSKRISKWEIEVKNFLDGSSVNYMSNDRTQLVNPNTGYSLELDIWMPELNKAIECNGIYWHTDKKRKYLDKLKQQLCKDKNIDLLTITDKEWDENVEKYKSKVINFIKN